jgi:hypothetical protein
VLIRHTSRRKLKRPNAHGQATPGSTFEAFHNLGWVAVDLLPARGCASSTTLHVDFNFSSTYSESSIMRSANCSAGSPAKFLSTSSFT